MDKLILVLSASPEDEDRLRDYLDRLQDRTSVTYHHWLTPEEFASRFAPPEEDVQKVVHWLQQNGLTLERVARSRRWIQFSGSAAKVGRAFRTEMHRYELNDTSYIANSADISVPSALSPVITGVSSLNNFFSRPQLAHYFEVQCDSAGNLVPVDPSFTQTNASGEYHFLAPRDVATIYNFAPLHDEGTNGFGQSIAIPARRNINVSDVLTFRRIFGLAPSDPTIIVNGQDPGVHYGGDTEESTLDVEWAGAAAPYADVTLVITGSTATTDGIDLSSAYIVENNLASIISVSYGLCESDLGPAKNAFYKNLWQQAAAQGISVFVASGDSGAAGCDLPIDYRQAPASEGRAVNGLASTPFDTAVGGTQFAEGSFADTYWNATNSAGFTSVKGYLPEAVWNESCDFSVADSPCAIAGTGYALWASGGGSSSLYAKPAWQTGTGVPDDGYRDVPDVALAAAADHDGYLACMVGNCQTASDGTLKSATIVGGTSVSAPVFAGIQALVNQHTGSSQGLANYILYKLAANQGTVNCDSSLRTDPGVSSTCVFNDVSTGNNGVPGVLGFDAVTGFDLATGLGSVNAQNLVNAWGAQAFQSSTTSLAASVSSAAHGSAVPLDITVSASSGSGTPTGDVALFSDVHGPLGSVTLSGGSFAGSINWLPGGQYNLSAHYQGDATFGRSDSAPVAMNISREGSTIIVTPFISSPSGPVVGYTSPLGAPIYIHAVVSPISGVGAVTGTVTFFDGANEIGSAPVVANGEAELVSDGFMSSFLLPMGVHSLSASYSGDSSFLSSTTNAAIDLTVTKADSALVVEPNPKTLSTNDTLLLHAYVKGWNTPKPVPTGTVTFLDGGLPISSPVPIAPPVEGQVAQALLVTSLPAGNHSISGSYSGDDTYNGSQAIWTQDVVVNTAAGAATETTVSGPTTAIYPAYPSYSISVTSQQTSPALTGTVQLFSQAGGSFATATLSNGSAQLNSQFFSAGPQVLIAQYSGDGTYAPSTSAPLTVTIAKGPTSLTLSSNASSVLPGKQVTLIARLGFTASTNVGYIYPPGNVQFYDAVNGALPQPLGLPRQVIRDDGNNMVSAVPFVLAEGTHQLTVHYTGDPDWQSADSNAITVTVANPSLRVLPSSDTVNVPAGGSGSVQLDIAITGNVAGPITLSYSGTLPVGSTCTIAPSSLTPGAMALTATLSVSSLAPSSASVRSASTQYVWQLEMAGFVAFGIVLVLPPRKRTRRMACMLAVVAVVLAGWMSGCGGGQNSPPPPPPPVPSNPVATTTTLSSQATKLASGQAVTLTATVQSSKATTGAVQFLEGSALLGQTTLENGRAQLTISNFSVGTHSITATYSGDAQNLTSTSNVLRQTITGTTQIQITASGSGLTNTVAVNITIQ